MTHYQIDIVSDTVCPWCYVGKKRLDLAVKQHQAIHPSDTFATTWHAFQLNPQMPDKSIDKKEFYHAKFGTQRTRMMQGHLARLGQQVGINFAFGGRTGNTRDSHRLIRFAAAEGGKAGSGGLVNSGVVDRSRTAEGMVSPGGTADAGVGGEAGETREGPRGEAAVDRLVDRLFQAYFEGNQDITDREVLIACAAEAGIDPAAARDWLASEQGAAEVEAEFEQARQQGVAGVPNYTINATYVVQGAEEPAAFLQIFDQIKDMAAAQGGQQRMDLASEGLRRPVNGADSC